MSVSKNFKCLIVLLAMLLSVSDSMSQKLKLERVEPEFWWVGMQHKEVQLLVYGENIATATPEVSYNGVEILNVHHADNPNYLFIDMHIESGAKAGTFPILFKNKNKVVARYNYQLKERIPNNTPTVDAGDVVYLITPDRFVNGDPKNDQVKGMKEGKNRAFHGGRHGGDIAGILSSLDYLDALGVTALWLNPVLENDMEEYSYHGYSTTDYYKVDPRFGSNDMYKQLADELHQRDMKLVMDMIFNHCGLEHWWMKDLPFNDWIHDYPDYQTTNHAIASVSDPHAAAADLDQMTRGWFVPTMPDLNHENQFLATYLIQNSIWWIEYAGLDGIRMDTYPYNNKEMMTTWAERVYKEYPGFYLLGETWVDNEAVEAFWADKGDKESTYNSKLASITDFPLCNAIHSTFKEGGNIYDLYNVLSKDFLYEDPFSNTIFAGNHDMDRVFYTIGEDVEAFNMAMTFLLTTRGVPQLYYGDEILMAGHGDHGILREDFPGGWKDDSKNAFVTEGRSAEQNAAFDHLTKLLNWRKSSTAIREGSLKHFVPHDNVYVYNRKSADESVLVIINNNGADKQLDMHRFNEVLKGYSGATDVLTGKTFSDLDTINLKAKSSLVLSLSK